MNNPDELKKALAKNGAYDHVKGEELRKKMVGSFKATVRKVERRLWVRSCLFAWLAVFAGMHFLHSSATKALASGRSIETTLRAWVASSADVVCNRSSASPSKSNRLISSKIFR